VSTEVLCDYCQKPAELVTGEVTYPRRPDLRNRNFWYCAGCQAWVSCHPPADANGRHGHGDGTVPMGRLANAELRQWRLSFHAVFDPIWKSGTMTRAEAYALVAAEMRLRVQDCHSSLFTMEQCREAVRVAAGIDLTGPRKDRT